MSESSAATATAVVAPRLRRRFEVAGVVQGVGFRPFVYVTAARLGLAGSVRNTLAGVRVEVEGDPGDVARFARALEEDPPPLALVVGIESRDVALRGGTGFTIVDSEADADPVGARTFASPDAALCADCRAELDDPGDRRHRHPFISCTHCGPRFTIITALPYDRSSTTMAGFAMCAACAAEYADPADRRFHAQPIACHDCGPRLSLVTGDGRTVHGDEPALSAARDLLADGKVVAVKGLGGYHLACDARNEHAVAELRRRKQRGDKPFAVMPRDLRTARTLVRVGVGAAELLTGPRAPILLLPRTGTSLAASVAPGNPDLGVLLPYTPLHVLLLGPEGDTEGPDVLVMTSGNLSGEPIVIDDRAAREVLAPLVDAWLVHDRPIRVPCDDSVTRWVASAELPVRRSRGYAPLPIALPFEVDPVLAVGADLKNACALASGRYAWVSQHIGDLDDLSTVRALGETVAHLQTLTGVEPGRLVADDHPGYRSGGWARQHADGRTVSRVQHHHAHIASVMGEHGLGLDDTVLGIAFDGTGYGTDGAVWGGEALVATYASFRRAAHLRYVPLAGGDVSVLRPYRMALSHLRAAGVPWDDDIPAVAACPRRERVVLAHQLDTGFGCVPTSSMGRLFDAVSSLLGVRHVVDYEAEAAIELESLARSVDLADPYRFGVQPAGDDTAGLVADAGPVVRAVVADVRRGTSRPVVAARFHRGVAELMVTLAEHERARTGLATVALGGGVFQNALLLETGTRLLEDAGFTVLRPRLLPPNDGGIALGQVLVGAVAHPPTYPTER
ncbi:MAG: carbamoyltransferase HypF [Nocardioidaceae bacterium]